MLVCSSKPRQRGEKGEVENTCASCDACSCFTDGKKGVLDTLPYLPPLLSPPAELRGFCTMRTILIYWLLSFLYMTLRHIIVYQPDSLDSISSNLCLKNGPKFGGLRVGY